MSSITGSHCVDSTLCRLRKEHHSSLPPVQSKLAELKLTRTKRLSSRKSPLAIRSLSRSNQENCWRQIRTSTATVSTMFDRPPSATSGDVHFQRGISPSNKAGPMYTSNAAITTLNDLDDFLNVEEHSSAGTSTCNSGTTSRGENSPRKLSFSNSKSSSATLIPHDGCDRCTGSGKSLIAAVNNGHTECLRRLLNIRGADPKAETTASGVTCVHIAAKRGDAEALRTLLTHDPECVLYRDGRGSTVGHVAAHSGHVQCLQELITAYDELGDLRNFDGATPAHFAASEGHLDALKVVVQASSTPDSRTTGGATPGKN